MQSKTASEKVYPSEAVFAFGEEARSVGIRSQRGSTFNIRYGSFCTLQKGINMSVCGGNDMALATWPL